MTDVNSSNSSLPYSWNLKNFNSIMINKLGETIQWFSSLWYECRSFPMETPIEVTNWIYVTCNFEKQLEYKDAVVDITDASFSVQQIESILIALDTHGEASFVSGSSDNTLFVTLTLTDRNVKSVDVVEKIWEWKGLVEDVL